MAKGKQRIRFLKVWRNKKPGDVLEPYALGLGDGLVRAGVAEWIELPPVVSVDCEESPLVECMAESPCETAAIDLTPVKRKRGRPRKMPLPAG